MNKKKLIIIGIEFVLGVLHIVGIGRYASKSVFILSASYFSDLALPFGFYFLLILNEENAPILRKWWVKACTVFLLATLCEIGQFFGLYLLGRTFDPIDIAVYAAGVLLAVFVNYIFSIKLNFWKIESRKIL